MTTHEHEIKELTQTEIEYRRIMASRMKSPKRVNDRDFGTNWSSDGSVKHTKKDSMMGEGLGPSLGLEAPKHTRSYRPGELDLLEAADLLYKEELRFKQSIKRQRDIAITQRFNAKLSERVREGKILVDQRIFLAYPKKDWFLRAEKIGGLPNGVDIAASKFGHLILVPVVEAKESSYKDYGRSFQLDPNIKAVVNQIFGAVQWTKPLTLNDVKQFGIDLE